MPEQRLGAGEIAVQAQHRRQIAQADRGFPVILAEHPPPDGQRFAMKRLGSLIQSLDPGRRVRAPTSVTATSGMLGARGACVASRAPVRGAGSAVGVVALVRQHDAEIVERLRHVHVLRRRTPSVRWRAPVRADAAPCRSGRAGDRSAPSIVSISACRSGWPASSFCTCAAPASSKRADGRLVPSRRESRRDRRSSAGPSAASLTFTAFAASRCARSRSVASRTCAARSDPASSRTTAAGRRRRRRGGAGRTWRPDSGAMSGRALIGSCRRKRRRSSASAVTDG